MSAEITVYTKAFKQGRICTNCIHIVGPEIPYRCKKHYIVSVKSIVSGSLDYLFCDEARKDAWKCGPSGQDFESIK